MADWAVLKFPELRRLMWSAVFIICVSVATVMMRIVWLRFDESPTVTTVETTTYPIWNIPFPAVTLCNNNKVYKSAAIRLAKNLWVQRNIITYLFKQKILAVSCTLSLFESNFLKLPEREIKQ